MKAVVWTKYGSTDGLILKEVPKPIPKDNEVLINIKAATVTAGDCEIRTLKLPFLLGIPTRIIFGIKNPKEIILGQEFAGQIAATGKNAVRFSVGDKVFGTTGFKFGAYAEYICLPEIAQDKALIKMPVNLTFDEAAAVPIGGLEALHFFRKSNVKKGEKVVINGAGGSIGTIAIQLFKLAGAIVTAVDTASKSEMMKSIGADYVIDYTKEDFFDNGLPYDIVFDVVGKSPFKKTLECLNSNGRYMLANPKISQMLYGGLIAKNKKVIFGSAQHSNADLEYLKQLIQENKIRPIIDKKMPLADVAKAHDYVEAGLKKGNLIITI